ncbi:SURF1 family cytochrome oxidase biogenesis protein [Sphingomicrobium clamense]|uniref:SURF1-like protein n=1 Tax=Sphingomicrobium clamense TaxID=2851013 RepID=A0ABS6V2I9_9SPHN|nr:SURF1 family protein [Sphingomicrobium sp. B8]MBW0143776.1 SURF1 family protein [Sphingomicrobium sp. B8]
MKWLTHLIVAAAVATMIGLGLWQLERKAWKEELLASYDAAAGLDAVRYPIEPTESPYPLYRRSSLTCDRVEDWRHETGANEEGEIAYVHVAECLVGERRAAVEIGWSREPVAGTDWQGGEVSGLIGTDAKFGVRLVSDTGLAGLQTSKEPDASSIPNNHLAYAVQWFAFALIAGVIYGLALTKRRRDEASS